MKDTVSQEALMGDTCVEVPEAVHVSLRHFYYAHRRYEKQNAHHDGDCWKSLEKYKEEIINGKGQALLTKLPIASTNDKDVFLFAFFNAWQLEKAQKYSSILFIDSTHNTCYAINGRTEKAFLTTIMIKDDSTGSGAPILFMLSNSETRWPLAEALSWLKGFVQLSECPTIMIDCCPTEVAAISSAFRDPEIRFCHWHMFRALACKVKNKIPLSKFNATFSNVDVTNEMSPRAQRSRNSSSWYSLVMQRNSRTPGSHIRSNMAYSRSGCPISKII